ncbi:unnamed protein product, partial [Trichogramma brassicae]
KEENQEVELAAHKVSKYRRARMWKFCKSGATKVRKVAHFSIALEAALAPATAAAAVAAKLEQGGARVRVVAAATEKLGSSRRAGYSNIRRILCYYTADTCVYGSSSSSSSNSSSNSSRSRRLARVYARPPAAPWRGNVGRVASVRGEFSLFRAHSCCCCNSLIYTSINDNSLRGMVQANSSDVCETRDPCQHGGICISTDSGPFCECRSAEYEGMYCEKDKASSEASFRGTEYLTIDLSKGKPVLSSQEGIFLQFKTKQPNGLLFYSGHGQDYMTISLRDGGVAVGMTLANGRLDMHIKPTRIRFDDNQWHKVMVHRKVQEISSVTRFCRLTASVDGIYTEQGHTAGAFTRLASERLLVGGGADARELAGSKGINNFVGCMRKVEFQAEGVRMELVEAARSGTVGAAAWGKIEFQCRDPRTSDPVTFTTGDSHLGRAPLTAAHCNCTPRHTAAARAYYVGYYKRTRSMRRFLHEARIHHLRKRERKIQTSERAKKMPRHPYRREKRICSRSRSSEATCICTWIWARVHSRCAPRRSASTTARGTKWRSGASSARAESSSTTPPSNSGHRVTRRSWTSMDFCLSEGWVHPLHRSRCHRYYGRAAYARDTSDACVTSSSMASPSILLVTLSNRIQGDHDGLCNCSSSFSAGVRSDAGREEHARIQDTSRRRLSALERRDTPLRGPAPAALVQRLSVSGNSAERGYASDCPSGSHTHHKDQWEVRQTQSSRPSSSYFYVEAHVRRTAHAQGIRGDQHLLPVCVYIIHMLMSVVFSVSSTLCSPIRKTRCTIFKIEFLEFDECQIRLNCSILQYCNFFDFNGRRRFFSRFLTFMFPYSKWDKNDLECVCVNVSRGPILLCDFSPTILHAYYQHCSATTTTAATAAQGRAENKPALVYYECAKSMPMHTLVSTKSYVKRRLIYKLRFLWLEIKFTARQYTRICPEKFRISPRISAGPIETFYFYTTCAQYEEKKEFDISLYSITYFLILHTLNPYVVESNEQKSARPTQSPLAKRDFRSLSALLRKLFTKLFTKRNVKADTRCTRKVSRHGYDSAACYRAFYKLYFRSGKLRCDALQINMKTPASGSPGVADDLIFSGAGSGCAGDDEDEDCTPIYENGSDDLITPVYVASTKSTVTVRPKIHAPSSNMQEKNIQCDDEEECNEEGSGDSGNSEDIFVPSSTARSSPTSGYNTTPRYAVQSSSPGLAIGTTQGSSSHRVEPHTTQATQHGYSVTSDSIPSSATERSTTTTTSTTPSTTTTTTTTSTTPSTTTTTSYYTIEHRTTTYRIPSYTVILPPKTTSNNNNNNNNKRITSETAENAALIIGIIAGALIAIVLIILIILKFKGRPEANYKIDDSKGFCQEPNAALLGAAGGGGAQMAGAGGGQSYNGSVKNGQATNKNGKGRQLKDIKECLAWKVN